jgi:hypothetical protein
MSPRDVPGDAANDCAFDAPLGLGLKRSDRCDGDERGEKSGSNFHVHTPEAGQTPAESFGCVRNPHAERVEVNFTAKF